MSRKRILIVDDHPLVRRQLQLVIETEPGLAVCGETDNAPDAITLVSSLKPDLVMVDLRLKNSSGLELI